MSLSPKISDEAASASADAVTALCANGHMVFYGGIKPPTSDTATDEPPLADLRFGSPAFGLAIDGVALANPITSDGDAPATGVATWFRVYKADGVSPVFDGTLGVGDTNIVVNGTHVQQHTTVDVSEFRYVQPRM